MKIRQAKSFVEIRDLMLKALKSDPTAFSVDYEEYKNKNDSWWKIYLNDYISRTRSRLLFAINENNFPIGMIGISYNKKERTKHIATIVWFFTEKKYRNCGVGKKLLKTLLEIISLEDSILKINLSVMSSQAPAIKLYLENGFKIVGVQKDEVKIKNDFFDLIIMEKVTNEILS